MLLKNALVFVHLLAMAVAVGKMLEYDFRFLRSVHRPISAQQWENLLHTKRTMTVALGVLWLTGLGFLYVGQAQYPGYLANEKLWMKVLTVCVLTLNGMLMHHFAFPHMQQGTVFLQWPLGRVLLLTGFATVSSISWLYASFLGIARSWNDTVAFEHALGVYVALLLLAAAGTARPMAFLHHRHARGIQPGPLPCTGPRGGCPR
ncbi:hypothetical protein [Acidovorax sp. SUPP2825]|uniref:hypothetical protein n=1 Tax=Acidovorax sp. SUPP2825 TaxID=2920879 RepID=UPI0023DE2114|nr:hypothetical protein [Acidovorax sp. SUPP2825]GKS95886.1 hypothetical protein AVAK2825_15145 [Acidovorax sp. SUPP2825]